jgi:nitrogen fixation/metabolism regulation signal transduction histidine kinase
MSLKLKYALFIIFIHTIIALLAYQLLKEQKAFFILAEVVIILSLVFSYHLYRSFIRPLQFMYTGVDAIRDKDFNVKFVKTGSKEMDRLIDVYNDMIDNIRIERTQVQEQHFFLMKLVNASPAGIIILDFDDKLTDINPKAMNILQLPKDSLNKQLKEFNHPILNQIALMEVNSSAILSSDGFEKYKCQISDFIHKGFNRKFILIQELSKEILEAEKRAYGKIIRMMAHEVNNSIGAINSILHTMADFYKEENSEWTEPLDIAINRNNRMNQFMRNFAKVVRLHEPQLEKTSINTLVRNIGKLMEEQAKAKDIQFVYQLNTEQIYASLDPLQMEQVLINIVKNSMESIDDSGKILFSTTANPATIIIRDNGSGISKEIANNIFTPFFSTKKNGQGVGLTLTREILINHNAQFSLKTVDDGWTEFRIVF